MIPNPSLVVGRQLFAVRDHELRQPPLMDTPERTLLAASDNVQQTLDFIEAEGLAQTAYITMNGDKCYPWLEAMILVQ